ncbi:MAG: NAD-dependent epimerase/dehydratase family protein [Saprospirales bacterium]|nr:MAG: NAD-dependent epimerase/dehydratase family protein [Saprospirales bacterium]
MTERKILLTGAGGQIGQILTRALVDKFGKENVIATDISENPGFENTYFRLDVLDKEGMQRILEENKITDFYHLAAVLSATGEKNPARAWEVNMNGLLNVLETARNSKVDRLFFPSSIAVFGEGIDREKAGQNAVLIPHSVYGISKAAGENWCCYYHEKYGLDVRSLRYPGVIGYESMPGGGTTDYAVDIFFKAIEEGRYTCFLREDARLPMIYMDDAIRATLELMDAPADRIKIRTSYNLQGMSFTPAELFDQIRKLQPDFKIEYRPDFRQKIADSWPRRLDDSAAREDWGWEQKFDIAKLTETMYRGIKNRQLQKS